MDKLLQYPGKTEQGVNTFLVEYEKDHLTKTASEYNPIIASYLASAKPIPGITQVLLTALGAGEYWGDNVNGDFFGEDQLSYEGPEYGYKTFETLAHVYKHHINKDPNKSYGNVIRSVYNPIFHRVELIVGVRHGTGQDIVDRIESGDYPMWSMGTKIPYDICSICGNKAPNRRYYCSHLKYQLGQIDPETNRKVFAINIKPKFFDISYVLVPADKTAVTLKKVASQVFDMGHRTSSGLIVGSAELAEHANKTAARKSAAERVASIIKEIPTDAPPASEKVVNDERVHNMVSAGSILNQHSPRIPSDILDRLVETHSMPVALDAMRSLAIMPKPQEFQRMYLIQIGKKPLADELDRQNICFDPDHVRGKLSDLGDDLGYLGDGSTLDHGAIDLLKPFIETRCCTKPMLLKRMTVLVKTANQSKVQTPDYMIPEDAKDPSIVKTLGAGALLYLALSAVNSRTAVGTLVRLIKEAPKTALELGAARVMSRDEERPEITPSYRGRFSPTHYIHPDTVNVYDRIQRMSERPYIKVSSAMKLDGPVAAAARRLLIGVPMIHMASNVVQKQRAMNPYAEQGAVKSLVRDHPNLVSGLLVADALLALGGKGTFKYTGGGLFKGASLYESAGIEGSTPVNGPDPAMDVVSSSIIWPLAFGAKNLPSRIVGGFIDHAIIGLGSSVVNRFKDQP